MVRTLMKHELFALFRVLVFFMAAVLIFAVLGRLMISINIANTEASGGNPTQVMLTVLLIMFYIFAIYALIFAAWALGVSRFYKTLFTGEGYMTLSLPATPMQLVWAKLLSALIAMFAASIVSVLSLVVFLVGWDAAIMQEIGEMFGELAQGIGEIVSMEPILFAEFGLLAIVSIPMTMLVCYAILSIGQLASSHRVLLSAGIAIGVYTVFSIFSNVVMTPVFIMSVGAPAPNLHVIAWTYIIACTAVDIGCFFLIRYILKNKVNLIA